MPREGCEDGAFISMKIRRPCCVSLRRIILLRTSTRRWRQIVVIHAGWTSFLLLQNNNLEGQNYILICFGNARFRLVLLLLGLDLT